jgi:hypothetical protein
MDTKAEPASSRSLQAITEMEVALAVIKPEFRAARAAALAASAAAGTSRSAHSRKKSSSEKKEDKKLRKERKDRERIERRAKREEAKAAELLKAGKSSHKKPTSGASIPAHWLAAPRDLAMLTDASRRTSCCSSSSLGSGCSSTSASRRGNSAHGALAGRQRVGRPALASVGDQKWA